MGKANGQLINKAFIEAMEPGAKVYRVPDAQTRSLYIQMTPEGVLSWVVRYRIHGREKTYTLGRWPSMTVHLARKAATTLLAEIGDGKDPATKKKEEKAAKTIKELAEHFTLEHFPTLKASTKAEYGRLLKKKILPALGSKRVKDVDSSDVARLLSEIRAATPKGVEANHVRAVLSKMFTMGALWGFCPAGMNPAHGQARAPETKRERHLSDKELIAVGAALRHLEPTPPGRESDVLPASIPRMVRVLG